MALALAAGATRRAAAEPHATRSRRRSRTSPRRRRPSSTCSWPAAPSQLELFEPKPKLQRAQRPDGARVVHARASGSRSSRATPSCSARRASSRKAGQCGMDISELLPHHREIADDVCWLRGDEDGRVQPRPGEVLRQHRLARSSAGRAWARGSPTASAASRDSLPGFVVLQSGPRGPRGGAALYWSAASCRASTRACRSSAGPSPILDLAAAAGRRRASSRASSSTR